MKCLGGYSWTWISLCFKVKTIWETKLTSRVIFNFQLPVLFQGASQAALLVKNLPASAGDVRDASSIPGWGRSPGGGHGNPLQYSCLENSMCGGAHWATVHGVAKSQTWLKGSSMHSCNLRNSNHPCFMFNLASVVHVDLFQYDVTCSEQLWTKFKKLGDKHKIGVTA